MGHSFGVKVRSFTLKAVCFVKISVRRIVLSNVLLKRRAHCLDRTQDGAFPNIKTYVYILKYVKIYCIFVYLIIKTLKSPSAISKLCHYPIFKTKKKTSEGRMVFF